MPQSNTSPMWVTLIPIIANYGLPLAEKLWKLLESKAEPTQADWDELNALANKHASDYLAEARQNLKP